MAIPKIIEFLRQKDFKFLKEIGQGGTGKTILIEDEIINEIFVCKKYSPISDEIKETYFKNFVDEIRILHKLSHRNIVRVFNYYLYPESTTGYILMEYVNGNNIRNFINKNPHLLKEVFIQTISGFKYLEENSILHRDIRPDNILVTDDGIVKIIDFGFGKKVELQEDNGKSISLNWRYSPPLEFTHSIYDSKTDIYFIGKLFEEIIIDNSIIDTALSNIVNKMIQSDPSKRINSFVLIERELLSLDNSSFEFSDDEKVFYKEFAIKLTSIITKIEVNSEYVSDIELIIMKLEDVYRNSILEDFIQNPAAVSRCFISGSYYFRNYEFDVYILRNFIELLKNVQVDKRRIILNNLWQRLDSIEKYQVVSSDLPF